ncbi:MAG: hypothetical protein AAF907_10230, partial [Planctomycetota bacterium]
GLKELLADRGLTPDFRRRWSLTFGVAGLALWRFAWRCPIQAWCFADYVGYGYTTYSRHFGPLHGYVGGYQNSWEAEFFDDPYRLLGLLFLCFAIRLWPRTRSVFEDSLLTRSRLAATALMISVLQFWAAWWSSEWFWYDGPEGLTNPLTWGGSFFLVTAGVVWWTGLDDRREDRLVAA